MEGPAKVLLALLVGGVAGVSGGAGGLSMPDSSPGPENVDVLWMSGVINNDRACVGVLGLHDDAYDLVADDSGPCYGPSSTQVNLRALGISSTPHVTLAAYISSEEDPYPTRCDYIEASTVQQPSGGTRGAYLYVHAKGSSGYWVDIEAGPNLAGTDVPIGSTTDDSNCSGGWEGYHTHQYADSPHSSPNANLPVNDDIPVWNVFFYIHKWTYPLLDTDGDEFTDAAELYIGTDYLDDCPNNPWDDAWPLDMDNNTVINLTGDAIEYIGKIGCEVAANPECQRLDLDTNGLINLVGDAMKYVGRIGDSCTNP